MTTYGIDYETFNLYAGAGLPMSEVNHRAAQERDRLAAVIENATGIEPSVGMSVGMVHFGDRDTVVLNLYAAINGNGFRLVYRADDDEIIATINGEPILPEHHKANRIEWIATALADAGTLSAYLDAYASAEAARRTLNGTPQHPWFPGPDVAA